MAKAEEKKEAAENKEGEDEGEEKEVNIRNSVASLKTEELEAQLADKGGNVRRRKGKAVDLNATQ